MIFETNSEKETYEIAENIGVNANQGDIYCLIGDLGVGKTVFTKGFANGLGIKEHITSPTFTIVNEYKSDEKKFYHFDVYRIDDEDEMYDIGFEEYIDGSGVTLIEWANIIEGIIPKSARWIYICKDLEKGMDYRKIEIKDMKESI